MDSLNLGQLFVMGIHGHSVAADAATLIRDAGIGGVILFSRNIDSLEQVVALNTELTALGTDEHPLLVSVDQEGGRVARLRGICTDLPPMRALGDASTDDPDLPYRVGAMMARELGALGFHLDYAPVLDVDTNPKNPVIGERSFASNANAVSHHAIQFLRGMQQAGVAACGKHFPGHGDTNQDSHTDLPLLDHNLARLEEVELPPFKAAAYAGVASIMTAHVMFPAIDSELPATLSEPILQGILRTQLGFDGVVFSDDVEMAALAEHWEIEDIVVRGLNAGVDMFLVCHTEEKVRRGIEAARKGIADGTVSEERVRQALARVARLKERFIGARAAPDLAEAQRVVRCGPHVALADGLTEHDRGSSRQSSEVDRA